MLELTNVRKAFREPDGKLLPILNIERFTVAAGEQMVLVGRSGSGKTTLLHVIAGISKPDAGSVTIDGLDITTLAEAGRDRFRADKIGYVFQTFNLIGDLTVYENVELPLTYRRDIESAERRRRVLESLERVHMANRQGHYPSQLSGGQQQRVAVARALVGNPSILLADEPTGNLDSNNGEAVMQLLAKLHEDGATICMVTHDPRYADYADRRLHLFDGRIVDDRSARDE